jgi:hypothetical protein
MGMDGLGAIWIYRSQNVNLSATCNCRAVFDVLVMLPTPPVAITRESGSVYEHSPASELELADAIATAHLTNVLDAHHNLYQVTGVSSTSLSDLRKGPWVGDSDDTATPQILQIADRKNQPGSPWTVDFHQPISAMTHDYAIIARFQASMTDGEVKVIAGLGSGGTECQQVCQFRCLHDPAGAQCASQLAEYEYGSSCGDRGHRGTSRPSPHHRG